MELSANAQNLNHPAIIEVRTENGNVIFQNPMRSTHDLPKLPRMLGPQVIQHWTSMLYLFDAQHLSLPNQQAKNATKVP